MGADGFHRIFQAISDYSYCRMRHKLDESLMIVVLRKLYEEQAEQLDGIDVLLVPVGGKTALNGAQAAEVVAALEPAIAIPMHYGAIVGSDEDAQKFKKGLAGKVEVLVLPKS